MVHTKKTHSWADAVKDPTKTSRYFTAGLLIEWINFLIDNLYVTAGDRVAKQIIGIPMGASCAPYLANLMLFMYELRFIANLVDELHTIPQKKWIKSRQWATLQKLSFCIRYIDDLWNPLVPEDDFTRIVKLIYPDFLILNMEP